MTNKRKGYQKTPNDVWGLNHCSDYIGCAICFGCRNYDSSNIKCTTYCNDDYNKCTQKNELHREELVIKLVSKKSIRVD